METDDDVTGIALASPKDINFPDFWIRRGKTSMNLLAKML